MVPELSHPFSVSLKSLKLAISPSSLLADAKKRKILYLLFKERKNEGREVAIITVLAGILMTLYTKHNKRIFCLNIHTVCIHALRTTVKDHGDYGRMQYIYI
jgi:hypothetical protein